LGSSAIFMQSSTSRSEQKEVLTLTVTCVLNECGKVLNSSVDALHRHSLVNAKADLDPFEWGGGERNAQMGGECECFCR
jgi:hypothetical protein